MQPRATTIPSLTTILYTVTTYYELILRKIVVRKKVLGKMVNKLVNILGEKRWEREVLLGSLSDGAWFYTVAVP